MSYDARTVANEFLLVTRASQRWLKNLQLEKLVYIAPGYSLAILHRPLVKQEIKAGRFGPVIPDLYRSLRQYGAGIVTDPITPIEMFWTTTLSRPTTLRQIRAMAIASIDLL